MIWGLGSFCMAYIERNVSWYDFSGSALGSSHAKNVMVDEGKMFDGLHDVFETLGGLKDPSLTPKVEPKNGGTFICHHRPRQKCCVIDH